METISVLMLAITTAMTTFMVLRIYSDWLKFREYLREGEQERLLMLQGAENGWVQRHFMCALAAIAMVAVIEKCTHTLRFEQLAGVTATYAIISLAFAFVESLFAQKLAAVTAAMNGAGKGRQTHCR